MSELVFCCPKCLCIDSTGVSIGSQETIDKIRNYPIGMECRNCRRYAVVPVSSTIISDQLDSESGEFRPFDEV